MSSSGVKITIKPRRGRGRGGSTAASSRHVEGPPPAVIEVPKDDVDDADGDSDIPGLTASARRNEETSESQDETESPEQDETVAASQTPEQTNDEDVTMAEAETPVNNEPEEELTLGPPVPRARGRPRGRPRGSGAGTSTGRTRGPGRPRGSRGARGGRGRGRGGGGLTIKLPRRSDEMEVDESGVAGEEATSALGPDGVAAEAGEEKAAAAPIGGGKPFRRINGQVYVIDGDEFVTEDDPKGDTKIDKNGNLLGGRKFKAQTFTLPNRDPERQYMLALEAARTSGFRDSLYYFRRNLLALKLNATQPEKDFLIEQGKLGSHLRTRSVTLITVRSAYKLHGAKMILDGRWVVDDYYEDRVLDEITAKGLKPGDPVGDLVDPNAEAQAKDAAAADARKPDRDRAGGSSASSMYRPGGPTTIFGGSGWGPFSEGPLNAVKKSMLNRDGVKEENFMWVAASRAMEASEEWRELRKEGLRACGGILGFEGLGESEDAEGGKRKRREEDMPLGVYEPHTGTVLYRSDTQPTRSRWEVTPDPDHKRQVLGGTKAGNGAWGLAWVDTVMEVPDYELVEDEKAKERERMLKAVGLEVL